MTTITVTVEQGGAGFAANEDLSVKKVDPEGRCDVAGVTLGMFVVEFQNKPLAPGTTWATLRQMVKGAERPWSFLFAQYPPGTINVSVSDGGAGFAANEDLSVRKVDPGKACDEAGVQVNMRVHSFQGEVLPPEETWTTLKAKVKVTPKPWEFTFTPPSSGTAASTTAAAQTPAQVPAPAPAGPSPQALEKERIEKAVTLALEKGQQAIKDSDFVTAIQVYSDGLKEDKKNEMLKFNLQNAQKLQSKMVVKLQQEGKEAIAAADYQQAIEKYSQALEIDPTDPKKVRASKNRAEADLATITEAISKGKEAMESELHVDAIKAFKRGNDVNAAHHELQELLAAATRQAELALINAAADGDAGRLDVLVKSGYVDVNIPADESPKRTAIMAAANGGHLMCVKQLLEHSADVRATDDDGMTALHYSCTVGHEDCVDALLDNDSDIAAKTSKGETSFDLATQAGHTAVLDVIHATMIKSAQGGTTAKMNKYLDAGVDMDKRSAEGGHTALMAAAEARQIDCVKALLEREASVAITDSTGAAALLYAARGGSDAIVKLLLEAGADAHSADSNGMTAFLASCKGGFKECSVTLFDAGSDAGTKTNDGETAFALATSGGHQDLIAALESKLIEATKVGNATQVTALVNGGFDSNAVSVIDKGRSLLILAAAVGSVACLDLILDNCNEGLKDKGDQDGTTAFHASCAGGHTDCVKALVAAGTDITATDNDGKTGWALATANGHTDVTRFLELQFISAGKENKEAVLRSYILGEVDINALDEGDDASSAFHICCTGGFAGCVEALVEAGCTVTTKNAEGKTGLDLAVSGEHESVKQVLDHAMISAAKTGSTERMTNFLDIGVSVDVCHAQSGRTALMEAAAAGHSDIVTVMINNSAPLEAQDEDGMTAYLLACGGGHPSSVKKLIAAGVNLAATAADGSTAADLANASVTKVLEKAILTFSADGNAAKLDDLIKSRVSTTATTASGGTALLDACKGGHVDCVNLLLTSDSDDVPDDFGRTAFHASCAGGHTDCVKALVAAGTDITATDNDGKTGWALATANGHTDVTRFLELQFISAGKENKEAVLRSYILGEVDINALDEGDDASSAFHICCTGGFAGCVEALVEAGCTVTTKNAEGKTGLDLAVSGEHESVKQVLDHAMISAAKTGSTERMTNFLDIGVSVDVCHAQSGRTALMEAAAGAHKDCTSRLLAGEADHAITDRASATALMLAAGAGAESCVTQLVDAGSLMDVTDESGRTAFMYACFGGHTEAVKILTSAGCNIEQQDLNGKTGWALAAEKHWEPVKTVLAGLLLAAAKSVDVKKLRSALAAGINVDAVSGSGRTALIEVATAGHVDLLMLLLGNGAGMEFRDADGTSAFHAACAGGHAGCAEILVKRGCKTSQRDGGQRLPMNHAKENGHTEVVDLLKRMKMVIRVAEDVGFSGDHTRYIVETKIDGDIVSTVTHRYSEFDQLRNSMLELQRWRTEVNGFVFPKKQSLAAVVQKKSAKVVERRVRELSQFMNSLIQVGELHDNDTLRAFIGAPFTKAEVMAPKPLPTHSKAAPIASAAPATAAGGAAGGASPASLASGSDAIVRVKVEEGGAGFAANHVLAVKKINKGEASDLAGVKVGMRVHSFQGEILPHGTTWDDLKSKVKASPRPWKFQFAGTVRVEVAQGGAGFAANEDLTVKKIDEGKACEKAGVTENMRVVEFQDKLLPSTTTWTDLRGMVKGAPKPWSFMFQTNVPAWEEDDEEDSDEDAL